MFKDYDQQIQYHIGKAKVMADALNRKEQHNLNIVIIIQLSLLSEFEDSNVQIVSIGKQMFNC